MGSTRVGSGASNPRAGHALRRPRIAAICFCAGALFGTLLCLWALARRATTPAETANSQPAEGLRGPADRYGFEDEPASPADRAAAPGSAPAPSAPGGNMPAGRASAGGSAPTLSAAQAGTGSAGSSVNTGALAAHAWAGSVPAGERGAPPAQSSAASAARPGPIAATGRPVLSFSDLVSGPKTGNSDTGLGQAAGQNGAVVTLWGTGLGESQGTSKVFAGGAEAARVYYWGKATPPFSPANLAARLDLQMIIFQVSCLAKDGPGQIIVTVGGRESNALAFTVRPGRIHFVAARGDDVAGDGSFARPWRSMPRAVRGMAAGDITYVGDGVKQTAEDTEHACVNLSLNGEPGRPAAFVAYPGATVQVGSDAIPMGFRNWRGGYGETKHWVISKFRIRGGQIATVLNTGWRVVGNYVTAPAGSAPSGAIEGGGSDLFVLGNEVTHVGRPGASKLYHPIYISSARAASGSRKPPESNREIAWNYIHDNTANVGINVYSEEASTAYMSGHKIHDNFIINQVGEGMLLGSYMTGENWIYNNVIANAGLGPEPTDGDRAQSHIGVQMAPGAPGGPATTLYFCHNTLYNCGWSGAVWGPMANGAIAIDNPGAFTLVFSNNLIVSTGQPYEARRERQPTPRGGHNLWFGAGPAPAWDTGALNADPLFVDPAGGDFRLRPGSPAIDRGVDLCRVAARDLDNVLRPHGAAPDLGAYEFVVRH